MDYSGRKVGLTLVLSERKKRRGEKNETEGEKKNKERT